MSDRLAEVGHRIATVRQLGTVVNAMRGIAATRAQQGRARLPAIRAYAQTVERAIGRARQLETGERQEASSSGGGSGRPGLILFGAEQGFAGAFVEQALDAAAADFARAHIFLIGNRAATVAAERGLEPDWTLGLPSGADALTDAAVAIVDAVYDYLSEAGAVPIEMLYPVWTTGHGVRIVRRSLLPLDLEAIPPGNAALPPLVNLAPAALIEGLAQEYIFALLAEAAVEAFSAENEARAATMASAKTNIEGKLSALEAEERLTRQEEITNEVVELASGALFRLRSGAEGA